MNGKTNTIETNQVTNTGSIPLVQPMQKYVFGIYSQQEGDDDVLNNTLTKMGTGLAFVRIPIFSRTRCNYNDHYLQGFSIIDNRIGPQGSATSAEDNCWTNFEDVQDYRITTNIVGGLPNFWSIRNYLMMTCDDLWSIIQYPSNVVQPQGPSIGDDCPKVSDPNGKQYQLAMIVTEQGDYADLPADKIYALKLKVYEELKNDNTLMNLGTCYDGILQDFFAYMEANNPGTITESKDLLINGNADEAKLLISSITPQNLSESNEKIVQMIYADTWAKYIYVFSEEQYDELYNIAMQSPFSGGSAVYSARVMLDLDVYDYTEEEYSGRPSNSSPESLGLMYPNPTTGDATYVISIAKGSSGVLQLYDMIGNQLQWYKLNEGFNQIQVKGSALNQGVYLYKLLIDGGFISAKKLTVVK